MICMSGKVLSCQSHLNRTKWSLLIYHNVHRSRAFLTVSCNISIEAWCWQSCCLTLILWWMLVSPPGLVRPAEWVRTLQSEIWSLDGRILHTVPLTSPTTFGCLKCFGFLGFFFPTLIDTHSNNKHLRMCFGLWGLLHEGATITGLLACILNLQRARRSSSYCLGNSLRTCSVSPPIVRMKRRRRRRGASPASTAATLRPPWRWMRSSTWTCWCQSSRTHSSPHWPPTSPSAGPTPGRLVRWGYRIEENWSIYYSYICEMNNA